mgnify:FL=1
MVIIMLKDLKVVFMGTPEFSVPVLSMLIENTNVLLVVTQPDKAVGRGGKVSLSPIKELALKNNIEVFQPVKIRHDYERVLEVKPDIIITCAYGQIIPSAILDFPRFGCINVHASLLPKLRGGAPIHHAIMDGYMETGVTIMFMDKGMDTGDMIEKRALPITNLDNVGTLHDKLSVLGSELLKETLPNIISGNITRTKQDDSLATYAYNIKKEEELLDFNDKAIDIFNKVRGLNPFPGSYLTINNKVLKIYEVTYELTNNYDNALNGTIVIYDRKHLGIKCMDGIIYLQQVKKEGKKCMDIASFINGEKENLKGLVVNENAG